MVALRGHGGYFCSCKNDTKIFLTQIDCIMKDCFKTQGMRGMLTLTLLATALTAFAANWNALPNVVFRAGYGQKLSIEIQQLNGPAVVQLADAAGNVLASEKATGTRYAKMFNLTELNPGTYTISVQLGQREIQQPFTLSDDSVMLDARQRREVFLPQIRITPEGVDLNVLNRMVGNVKVIIRASGGETVFEDEIRNVVKVERRYKLDQLERGAYDFIVHTPDRVFYQQIVRD